MLRRAKLLNKPSFLRWGFVLFFIFLVVSLKNILFVGNAAVLSGKQFKVAIFKENGFPAIGTPTLLTPEWLYNCLSKYSSVTYLGFSELSDRRHLNLDNFDLLVLPYGEAFPYKAFSSIKEYLFEGGGLFNIAGRPFWVAMDKIEGEWQKKDIESPYKDFLSALGIKYYEFLDSENIGLSVTTSIVDSPIKPTHGNIFPYRIPARDFYSLGRLEYEKNEQPIILIKSWQNPYKKFSKNPPKKWCFIGARGERHPLNPQDPHAKDALIRIMRYLSFPVIIYGLETNLAAYRQKEKVRISLKILNYEKAKYKCVVEFKILDKAGQRVYKKDELIELEAGQRVTLSQVWHPKEFKSDFYKVIAILKAKDRILDKQENGFVVIDENVLKNGPSIGARGNKLLIDGRISYIKGINYYESKLGELMWLRPNMFRIREDFKAMQALGINFVRIHYHHSKWFRDYFAKVAKEENINPYFQVADTKAMPSERSLRILDALIQLAQEQGLIFCMDIFSLVPEDMGNPIGWLGLKERIIDAEKIAMQKKFIKVLASRYKEIPGITWDLWNEPHLEKNDLGLLRDWAKQMKDIFRENGDNHLITIGDNSSLRLLDVLDYASIHTYEPDEFSHLRGLDKPFIFQEVWNDAGCSLNEEVRQAEELKKDFNSFLKTEAAGFVPWQWTRQARLWDNASEAEKWDNELGVCVREDGTLKPAGKKYKDSIN